MIFENINKHKVTLIVITVMMETMVKLSFADDYSKNFESGWHIISIPCSFNGSDPGTIFGPPFGDVYGLEDGEIIHKNDLAIVAPGKGYWAYFSEQAEISLDCANIIGSDYTVQVIPGWNMVGSPFVASHWNESTIDDVSVAVSPKIMSSLYSYNNSLKDYELAGVMTEWNGYFVKVGETGTLKFISATDNNPPVADAGPDEKWFVGKRYEFNGGWDGEGFPIYQQFDIDYALDGGASIDPDGDAITYSWTQTGGPAVELSDTSISNPIFVPVETATYTFQLEVSDGQLTDTNTVDIYAKDLTGKLVMRGASGAGGEDTYIYDFDSEEGGTLSRITSTKDSYEFNPFWSPSGDRIFASVGTSTYYLSFMDEDGGNINTLEIEGRSSDWSPSGKVLFRGIYNNFIEIYEMTAPEDGTVTRLTENGLDSGGGTYSYDETKIVYNVDHGGTSFPMKIMDSDGGNNIYLINDGKSYSSKWNKFGQIVFRDSSYNLFKINPDGTGREELLSIPGLDIRDFAFNEDETILFFCNFSTDYYLHVIYMDGSKALDLGVDCVTLDYHPGP